MSESGVPGANRIPRSDGRASVGLFLIKQVEINFGTTPTSSATFTVVDPDIEPGDVVMVSQSASAATNRQADENDMDVLLLRGVPYLGGLTIYASSLQGPVTGAYKITYLR